MPQLFLGSLLGTTVPEVFSKLNSAQFLPVSRFSSIACKEALHLGESGGVTQESQAKGDAGNEEEATKR